MLSSVVYYTVPTPSLPCSGSHIVNRLAVAGVPNSRSRLPFPFSSRSSRPVLRLLAMSQGQNFLPKFLFVSNLLKAVKIRQRVPNDVVKPGASGGLMHHLRGMHRYTLEMIAMNHFPQAFREVVQAAILDRAMQVSLEQEKKLNWCREVKKMVPLRTNGKTVYQALIFLFYRS